MTTALINATTPTEFVQANYPGQWDNGPAVITLSAPIGLSLDDVAGVLYDLGKGMRTDEFADDEHARQVITDIVFNAGLVQVEDWRRKLDEIGPDHPGYNWLLYSRQRATELFPAAAPTGVARELAAVGVAR